MAVSAEFLNEATNYIPLVAHRWDFIGIKLYQGNLVQALRYTERSAAQKLTEILQAWLNGPKAPGDDLAAWKVLVDSLRSPAVNLGAAAKKIEETHVRPLEQVAREQAARQRNSRGGAQALVTGMSSQAIRDSDTSPSAKNYHDIIKRQGDQLIHWPNNGDDVNDAVRDQPHGDPPSDQLPHMTSASYDPTFLGQHTVVPDSPYYRHGNPQQGNPHMQTRGGVHLPTAEPNKQLVLNPATPNMPPAEHIRTDNTLFTSSFPSQNTSSGCYRGNSPAMSPTVPNTRGVDRLPPSPEIQELLDKRMSVDDPADRRCLLQLARRLPKWRYFGLYLNLPESTLDETDRSGVDADDKAVTMLMRWVKESQTGTRATLVQCLEEVGYLELMHELKHTGALKSRDPVK